MGVVMTVFAGGSITFEVAERQDPSPPISALGVLTYVDRHSYVQLGSGCRLVAVPAFKAVRGAIALSLVGSIPTPSASIVDTLTASRLKAISFDIGERDSDRPVKLFVHRATNTVNLDCRELPD